MLKSLRHATGVPPCPPVRGAVQRIRSCSARHGRLIFFKNTQQGLRHCQRMHHMLAGASCFCQAGLWPAADCWKAMGGAVCAGARPRVLHRPAWERQELSRSTGKGSRVTQLQRRAAAAVSCSRSAPYAATLSQPATSDQHRPTERLERASAKSLQPGLARRVSQPWGGGPVSEAGPPAQLILGLVSMLFLIPGGINFI